MENDNYLVTWYNTLNCSHEQENFDSLKEAQDYIKKWSEFSPWNTYYLWNLIEKKDKTVDENPNLKNFTFVREKNA